MMLYKIMKLPYRTLFFLITQRIISGLSKSTKFCCINENHLLQGVPQCSSTQEDQGQPQFEQVSPTVHL